MSFSKNCSAWRTCRKISLKVTLFAFKKTFFKVSVKHSVAIVLHDIIGLQNTSCSVFCVIIIKMVDVEYLKYCGKLTWLLRRKCCLCNDMWKWLDFQVFSDKADKP